MEDRIVKQVKTGVIISSVASIIMGIMFLANPLLTGFSLCYCIGAMTLISGLFEMVFCFSAGPGAGVLFLDGLLNLLMGSLFVSRPDAVATLLVVFMGMYVIMHGCVLLTGGFACLKAKVPGGVAVLVMGALLLILGLNLMFAPFTFIMVMAGVSLLLDGVCELCMLGSLGQRVKEAQAQLKR